MSVPSIQTTRGWSGLTVVDSDDHPLGKIVHIYLDRDTEQAEWALVAVAGRRRRTFVPLAGAARKGNRVAVAVSKAAMSDAPAIRPGRELSDDDAARLYGHYVGASGDHRRGARRAPGRGLATRFKEATAPPARSAAARLGTARSRAPGAARSDRGRRVLSLAGLGLAATTAFLAGRARSRRTPGVGEALGGMLAATRAPLTGRRPRTRRAPTAGNFKLAAGLAAGYVLGARAGRERYERLAEMARQVADRPEVQRMAGRLRGSLGDGFDRATNRLSDRLERARSAQPSSRGPEGTPPEPKLPVPEVPEAELAEPGRVARARR